MEAVNQYGTFLDNHAIKTERCNLYAVAMFFVEVVYDPKSNTITELRSFKTGIYSINILLICSKEYKIEGLILDQKPERTLIYKHLAHTDLMKILVR